MVFGRKAKRLEPYKVRAVCLECGNVEILSSWAKHSAPYDCIVFCHSPKCRGKETLHKIIPLEQ